MTRDVDVLATGASDDAAIRSLLTEVCAVPCPDDGLRFDLSSLAIAGAFTFKEDALQRAIAACFERRGTPWTRGTPGVLTLAFYQRPELATRWRSCLATSAVLMPPPAQVEVIGERIIQLLAPVRAGILANETLERTWMPGGPWV